MGVITALEPQRRSSRVNVYVDGEFALGLHASVAEARGLHIGQTVQPDDLTAASRDEERRRAIANAVKMLESRSRSRQELESRLYERAYSADVVSSVIAHLTNAGLVDDTAFAQQWVGERSKGREPVGRIRLKHELKAKGITKELTELALNAVNQEDELEQATRAAHRHARPYSGFDGWRAERNRLAGYLQRRGYGWDVTHAALREVIGKSPEDHYTDDNIDDD